MIRHIYVSSSIYIIRPDCKLMPTTQDSNYAKQYPLESNNNTFTKGITTVKDIGKLIIPRACLKLANLKVEGI